LELFGIEVSTSVLLQYAWTLLVLIALEGILAADNALVIAVMVKHLPPKQRKKAIFYGLAGAFVFRFASLFTISFLVDVWQVQAIGALYLLFIAANHFFRKSVYKAAQKEAEEAGTAVGAVAPPKKSGFWMTVLKVELADIAFAVDSILAAVALAVTLPYLGTSTVGGMNIGQFYVVLAGGIIGLILMRFAATWFVKLLDVRPGLEKAAFLIVGWVGVKLAVYAASHEGLGWLSKEFAKSLEWKLFFWAILLAIFAWGWFSGAKKPEKSTAV
jgi:YkoY family integral membrane protein